MFLASLASLCDASQPVSTRHKTPLPVIFTALLLVLFALCDAFCEMTTIERSGSATANKFVAARKVGTRISESEIDIEVILR